MTLKGDMVALRGHTMALRGTDPHSAIMTPKHTTEPPLRLAGPQHFAAQTSFLPGTGGESPFSPVPLERPLSPSHSPPSSAHTHRIHPQAPISSPAARHLPQNTSQKSPPQPSGALQRVTLMQWPSC